MKRKALGKGLSSLIPSAPPKAVVPSKPGPSTRGAARPRDDYREVDVDQIRPNRQQPRRDFDEDGLEALARSLKNDGVIQPIAVRRLDDGRFEILAGERRWRAAQRAGLLKIPAVIHDVEDERLLEYALIENLQREELNPMEEAGAYRTLIDDLGLTQEDVARRVGRRRATVANILRLLTLPKKVQTRVRKGEISTGHAKALAALDGPGRQVEVADRIVRRRLSVRQTEQLVARMMSEPEFAPRGSDGAHSRDPNVEAAEQRMQQALGTKVRIVQNRKGRGRIEIHFHNEDELRGLYDTVLGKAHKESRGG
jgi:ParB family chromosome partitioning protein